MLFLACRQLVQHQILMSILERLICWVLKFLPGVMLWRKGDHRYTAHLLTSRADLLAQFFQLFVTANPSQYDLAFRMQIQRVASHQRRLACRWLASRNRHGLALQARFDRVILPVLIQQPHDSRQHHPGTFIVRLFFAPCQRVLMRGTLVRIPKDK